MSEQDQNSPEDKEDFEEKNNPEENGTEMSGEAGRHPDAENPVTPEDAHEEPSGEFSGVSDDNVSRSGEEGSVSSGDPDVGEPAGEEESIRAEGAPENGTSSDFPLDDLEEIVGEGENGSEVENPAREEVVDDLAHIIESIVFASDEPLPVAAIKSVLDAAHTFGRVNPDMITARISALNAKYDSDNSGFHIVEIANGFQYATRKDMAQWVSNLFKERSKRKLTNSALETVAIIAYKQPITKPEIESIRGVNVDYVLHNLLEKEIVTVVGRAETVGRPLLYGTTQKFLKIFTLKNLEDLPKLREIEEIIKEIKSRGAEESIQLEITALGESLSAEPASGPEPNPETPSDNGKE